MRLDPACDRPEQSALWGPPNRGNPLVRGGFHAASPPVSRILSGALRLLGDHPSGLTVARELERPTRGFAGGQPIPLLGLAPDGVYRAAPVARDAGGLLPHRFTLACARIGPSAVCSLLHFPSGFPAWPLASILPCGVRTFLGSARAAVARRARRYQPTRCLFVFSPTERRAGHVALPTGTRKVPRW